VYAPNKQDREKEKDIGTITESCRQWMDAGSRSYTRGLVETQVVPRLMVVDGAEGEVSARAVAQWWLPSTRVSIAWSVKSGTDSKNLCIGQYDKFFEKYCLLPIL
jgi:hypothetical protein